MKKLKVLSIILAALIVASVALVGCSGDDTESATTTAATTAKTTTTVKTTATATTTDPADLPPDPVPEVPITGDAFLTWHASHTGLVATDIMLGNGAGYWPDGAAANLVDGFDGFLNATDPATKIGASKSGVINLTFECHDSKITAYAFVTGGDSDEYPQRNPSEWVLYGSDDNATWEVIDDVYNANMVDTEGKVVPNMGFGYSVDNPQVYSYYKFTFSYGTNAAFEGFQLNEMYIYTDAPAA